MQYKYILHVYTHLHGTHTENTCIEILVQRKKKIFPCLCYKAIIPQAQWCVL